MYRATIFDERPDVGKHMLEHIQLGVALEWVFQYLMLVSSHVHFDLQVYDSETIIVTRKWTPPDEPDVVAEIIRLH